MKACTECGEMHTPKAAWQHEGGICMMERIDSLIARQRRAGREVLERAGIKLIDGAFDGPVNKPVNKPEPVNTPEEEPVNKDRKTYMRDYMRNRRKGKA